jgi:hypothetical protein
MNIVQKQPEFKGSEAIVVFIGTIDRLFDLLNSRNPHGKGFEKLSDTSGWQAALQSTAKYLLSLKLSKRNTHCQASSSNICSWICD